MGKYSYTFPLYVGTVTNGVLDVSNLSSLGKFTFHFRDYTDIIGLTGNFYATGGIQTEYYALWNEYAPEIFTTPKFTKETFYNDWVLEQFNVSKVTLASNEHYVIHNPSTGYYANLGLQDKVSFSAGGLGARLYDSTGAAAGYTPICLSAANAGRPQWLFLNYENGAVNKFRAVILQLGVGQNLTNRTASVFLNVENKDLSTGGLIDGLNTFLGNYDPIPSTDPFSPGGSAEPGGGNGSFNGTSDNNPIPGDPAISATDTGFMTVFATNTAGLRSLANSLWTDLFSAIQPGGTLEETVKALKNIVASPYDAILGCHIVPVNVPTGSSRNVKLYGVLPSDVSLPVASSQWVHKDCGSLTIQPYDGSYLDYAPYSKVTSLYLPFVGVVSVDIDIIMNTTIGVYYKIDIVSGQCIVYVTKNGDVYFQYQGQCAVPIPVTSIDWSTTVSSGLGLIGSVTSIVGSAVGGFSGGAAGALGGAVKGTMENAGAMAQNVMNSKPDIKAGSGVGGAAALMGCKSPYLIIERPRKSTPKNQNHYTGYPSNIRAKLGDLSGYTEVSRVYVNHMNATQEEKEEIETLLNGGVIL